MKKSIIAYALLGAVFCISACTSTPPEQKKPDAVKPPSKTLTPEQITRQKTMERRRAFQTFLKSFGKKPFGECIQQIKDKLKDPELAADPMIRLAAYEQIVAFCRMPGWTALPRYDASIADTELVPAAMAIINDKELHDHLKVKTYSHLAEYYAGLKDFKKAETVARQAIALPKLDKTYRTRVYLTLSDVYRWNEDYAAFKRTVMDAMKHDPVLAARHGVGIALRYGKTDDAAAFWKAANDLYAELSFYSTYNQRNTNTHYGGTHGVPLSDRTADARKYAADEKNPPQKRFDIAARYCMDSMDPADVAVRKSLMNIPAAAKSSSVLLGFNGCFHKAFGRGDYRLVADLCELLMDTKVMTTYSGRMIYVSALGAIGRKADAHRLLREYAADEKLSAVEKTTCLSFAALLEKRDVMTVIKTAKLTNKEEYTVLRSVARQCLLWEMMEEAEKYAAQYEKYFAMPEDRVLAVKYFEKPVNSIANWRKIYGKLEKQYCNIPYRGALDFFETDVATGTRNVKFDPTEKPLGTTEITAAADRYGVHVFLRVEAENARAVEQGFAKAVSPECYFAPGHNQPYVCFGADPVNKSEWTFHTTYSNKGTSRLDNRDPARSYRTEYAFSDTDYVIHIFFGWETHYNKLPENGSEYLFEAIVWTPAGGMTWGGSQGPHGVSDWGRLRFELSKEQLNEIRKEIIFKTYKGYKNIIHGGRGGRNEDVFSVWAADVIGDPAFYEKYLAPLKETLERYAKMVKADMTDEEVETVYVNALPLMKGLKYEVEELRRKYLEETLMQ